MKLFSPIITITLALVIGIGFIYFYPVNELDKNLEAAKNDASVQEEVVADIVINSLIIYEPHTDFYDVASAAANHHLEPDLPNDERVAVELKSIHLPRVVLGDDKYQQLFEIYSLKKGPFFHDGVMYLPRHNNQGIAFNGMPSDVAKLILSDPDQYLELVVSSFTETEANWVSNWGGGFDELDINYHYCKPSSCLIRAYHNSVFETIDYVEAFKVSNPDLEVEEHIMRNGSMVLVYSKI